jgi:hypothetical protein
MTTPEPEYYCRECGGCEDRHFEECPKDNGRRPYVHGTGVDPVLVLMGLAVFVIVILGVLAMTGVIK